MNSSLEERLVRLATEEDIGDGDHTSLSCIPADAKGEAQLIIKQEGILAGIEVSKKVFGAIDPSLKAEYFLDDGKRVKPGDIAFSVSGNSRHILQAERLVLNFMQRMSGIATETAAYMELLKGTGSRILDTRKTSPGLRIFEKQAVRTGGGMNHRMGLYDMIMLKDNHIDMAGGIVQAIDRVNGYLKETGREIAVEIETRSIEDVKTVIKHGGVQRIMLDNFNIEDTREAVKLIGSECETESSGGITKENIRDYALCGVDFISVGALTHQILSLDMSLKVK